MKLFLGSPLPNNIVVIITCILTPTYFLEVNRNVMKAFFMIFSSGLNPSKQMQMLSEIMVFFSLLAFLLPSLLQQKKKWSLWFWKITFLGAVGYFIWLPKQKPPAWIVFLAWHYILLLSRGTTDISATVLNFLPKPSVHTTITHPSGWMGVKPMHDSQLRWSFSHLITIGSKSICAFWGMLSLSDVSWEKIKEGLSWKSCYAVPKAMSEIPWSYQEAPSSWDGHQKSSKVPNSWEIQI